jgi:preprotein translocase subunit YajC
VKNIVQLLPFLLLIGAVFLMTRSARNKQRAQMQMRETMQPGTGVRTIGGLYAIVKAVNEDTVLLEVAPGVHAHYAKNAIGAVLEPQEYARIIDGGSSDDEAPVFRKDEDGISDSGVGRGQGIDVVSTKRPSGNTELAEDSVDVVEPETAEGPDGSDSSRKSPSAG